MRYVSLDNEIMLWNSTHRDVHPAPVDYDELWATRTVPFASAMKALDPNVMIFGPVTWGWCDLFTSAKDAAIGPSCINGVDRQAHGGLPLTEWYLKQACDYQAVHGVRLIDDLDVHYYPQADQQHDIAGTGSVDESAATAVWHLRPLKELYDPSYVQDSWIAEAPQLIPRLRNWIAARCPGTKIAITEYKWGPTTEPPARSHKPRHWRSSAVKAQRCHSRQQPDLARRAAALVQSVGAARRGYHLP